MIPAECGHAKPEPAIFASALASLGLAAEAAVYVGHDPEEDAPGAEAAGLQVLLLREGDTLSDLPARIQALATLGR
jgi:putative hydrolase of the HAD superfamily